MPTLAEKRALAANNSPLQVTWYVRVTPAPHTGQEPISYHMPVADKEAAYRVLLTLEQAPMVQAQAQAQGNLPTYEYHAVSDLGPSKAAYSLGRYTVYTLENLVRTVRDTPVDSAEDTDYV